jgi:hypothetical protein
MNHADFKPPVESNATHAIPDPETVISARDAIFRYNSLLVMHAQAILPDRCIKSNQPAEGYRLKFKVTPSLTCPRPIRLLASLLNTVRATPIEVGLGIEWRRKRRKVIYTACLITLFGIALYPLMSIILDFIPRYLQDISLCIPAVIILIGLSYGYLARRVISITQDENEWIWIRGACPEYLTSFPPLGREEDITDYWGRTNRPRP